MPHKPFALHQPSGLFDSIQNPTFPEVAQGYAHAERSGATNESTKWKPKKQLLKQGPHNSTYKGYDPRGTHWKYKAIHI